MLNSREKRGEIVSATYLQGHRLQRFPGLWVNKVRSDVSQWNDDVSFL